MRRIVVLGRGGAGKVHARSRENWDFWCWVITYRVEPITARVAEHATHADVHVLRGPRAVARFLALR